MTSSRRPLSWRIRAELFSQLAKLEGAGVPFDRSMQLLQLSADGTARLQEMRHQLALGLAPAAAGERAGVFTRLEARLIHAAFNAGSPAAMYQRLADFCTDRSMQLATLKSRLLLPAAILLASLLLGPLPALVGGSIGLIGYLWLVVRSLALLAALFYVVRWWFSVPPGDKSVARLRALPLYGPMFVRRNLRDFFESLALLLDAGVSMLDALPAALDTVEDAEIRRDLAGIRRNIEHGASFAGALRETTWFGGFSDARAIEFVQTGEAGGKLPEMMQRHVALETAEINAFYEQLAAWIPRAVYALVVISVVYRLLAGSGIVTRVD